MRLRSRKLLLIIPGLILLWLTGVTASIWQFGEQDHAQHSDCIIVLGAAVQGSQPSPVFEARINHAISLYQQGKASAILFTGGFGEGATHAESQVASQHAQLLGIPSSAIHIETQSKTTQQNLREAKTLMQANGLTSAIIVSDPLHLKRASIMAEDLELNAVTSPTPSTRYQSLKTKLPFALRETYFLHHYLLTGQ